MVLSDVLIGGEAKVEEHYGSQHVQQGDILYGQLCHLPDVTMLSRMAPLGIPPGRKANLIVLRTALRKKIAKQNRDLDAEDLIRYRDMIRTGYLDVRDALTTPPTLTNTDGDLLEMHTL